MAKVPTKITFLAVSSFAVVSLLSQAWAAKFSDDCENVLKCVDNVSKLTGQKYIFANDIDGKVLSSKNVELNPENAELLFTHMLHLNGLTRVPMGAPNTFQILRKREARDTLLPRLMATKDESPSFPDIWDLFELHYQVKNPESIREIARVGRRFLPEASRMMISRPGRKIVVVATAPELRRVYQALREADQKIIKKDTITTTSSGILPQHTTEGSEKISPSQTAPSSKLGKSPVGGSGAQKKHR